MKGVERNRRCKQEREEPKLSEAEDLWDYRRIPGHCTYLAWRLDASLCGLAI